LRTLARLRREVCRAANAELLAWARQEEEG
jgi:hypothetical protein